MTTARVLLPPQCCGYQTVPAYVDTGGVDWRRQVSARSVAVDERVVSAACGKDASILFVVDTLEHDATRIKLFILARQRRQEDLPVHIERTQY